MLAALTNALRVRAEAASPTSGSWSPAAVPPGSAIVTLLLAGGAGDVVVGDRDGPAVRDDDTLSPAHVELAARTNPRQVRGTLQDGAASTPTSSSASRAPGRARRRVDPRRWPKDPVVFALANPDPEVDPAEAAKYAAVVASGRSDYPNQINNVLAFPGVFRGLLDARAHEVTVDMLLRAAEAIAHVVTDEEINPSFIIPSVFHPDVPKAVAAAISGKPS